MSTVGLTFLAGGVVAGVLFSRAQSEVYAVDTSQLFLRGIKLLTPLYAATLFFLAYALPRAYPEAWGRPTAVSLAASLAVAAVGIVAWAVTRRDPLNFLSSRSGVAMGAVAAFAAGLASSALAEGSLQAASVAMATLEVFSFSLAYGTSARKSDWRVDLSAYREMMK